MKIIKYLTSAVLVFGILTFLSSCGDDDSPTNLSFEGRLWTLTSYSVTSCTDIDDNENGVLACTALVCSTIFAEAGTFTFNFTQGGVLETDISTYTIDGNILSLKDGSVTLPPITFTIAGNTLTMVLTDPFDACLTTTVYKAL